MLKMGGLCQPERGHRFVSVEDGSRVAASASEWIQPKIAGIRLRCNVGCPPWHARVHLPIDGKAGSKPAPSVMNERARFVAQASSLQPTQPGMAALRSGTPPIGGSTALAQLSI
jgi:hypothetical protein